MVSPAIEGKLIPVAHPKCVLATLDFTSFWERFSLLDRDVELTEYGAARAAIVNMSTPIKTNKLKAGFL